MATYVKTIDGTEILAKRAEQTLGGVTIDDKFGHIMDLQANQGTAVSEDDDLDTYVTPGTYFIPNANLMVTLSNTPYAQMQLSDASKTGQSHLYVYRTKNDEFGRVTQLLITPYPLDPANDNTYGIWYRQSGDIRNDTWGLWHRVGEGGSDADTVDHYHISVGNLGTDANTIYFV